MKIFLGQIALLGILLTPFVSFASNVKTALSALEDTLGIEDTDMYTMIHARDLSQQLQKTCDKEDISRANELLTIIKKHLQQHYASTTQAAMLNDSWNTYQALQDAHTRASRLPEGEYCTLKFVLYQMQNWLREEHIAILEETQIINDFDGFGSSSAIYGAETKIDMLDMMIQENKKYKDLIDTDIAFKRLNNSFKDSLSADAQTILSKSEVLMALTVYKALYNLTQAGLFDQNDIDELQNKIDFEFVDSCQTFHGKYELRETIDSKGHHVSYDTNGLHLKVNLCGNYFVLRDLDIIFEKIVTHELAHHFYYYHDTKRFSFEDICWKNDTVKRAECSSKDFVTEYAQTLSTEDYAEHFMYRFLDLIDESTSIIERKSAHFEQYK